MNILGHDRNIQVLNSLIKKNKIPSTLLFYGSKGVGKNLIAKKFAKSILCQHKIAVDTANISQMPSCDKCKSCIIFESLNHPDFIDIQISNTDQWNAESIRTVLSKLTMSSFFGEGKVAIFSDSDEMSIQISNIILKTLEEPSLSTIIILLASNPGKLLKTITSRCQQLYFNDLDIENIRKILTTDNSYSFAEKSRPDSITLEENVKLSNGSLFFAKIINNNQFKIEFLKDALDNIEKGNIKAIFTTVKEIYKNKDDISLYIQLLILIAKLKIEDSIIAKDLDLKRLKKISILIHNLDKSLYLIEKRNINIQYILPCILLSFADIYKYDFSNQYEKDLITSYLSY